MAFSSEKGTKGTKGNEVRNVGKWSKERREMKRGDYAHSDDVHMIFLVMFIDSVSNIFRYFNTILQLFQHVPGDMSQSFIDVFFIK